VSAGNATHERRGKLLQTVAAVVVVMVLIGAVVAFALLRER
jgi:hypothetical protein